MGVTVGIRDEVEEIDRIDTAMRDALDALDPEAIVATGREMLNGIRGEERARSRGVDVQTWSNLVGPIARALRLYHGAPYELLHACGLPGSEYDESHDDETTGDPVCSAARARVQALGIDWYAHIPGAP